MEDKHKPVSKPRPCGDCSLCCDGWVKTNVNGHAIDVGQPCPYSSGHNCTIHESRPEDPCRIFYCGWTEPNSRLPEWMKPSKSGVIVITGRSSWRGRPVDMLVSTGNDIDKRVMNWFQKQALKERRPFVFQSNEQWFGFGPPEFQQGVREKGHLLFEK
ncbi:MAG: hypothetical protein COB33_005675 [Thiotrichaceae bacterium]|nr:hypothetical protein [Thiotrichaceae bacterium]